jgi:polysaccharide deacetylase family protein (PEP-CTERM system associated)
MSGLLLSVDLEDVRDWVKNGHLYLPAVEANTRNYLAHFRRWGVRATFFTVGEVARRYPRLITEILTAGHELACHGDVHLQLDKLTPAAFRADMEKNVAALKEAGAVVVKGFRAPTFSLTARTAWAHEVLADLGFTYSSSVLPARNPLYGWPEFGAKPRQVVGGLWELPVTLHDLPGLKVPIAGGVYFRVLPFFLTAWAIRKSLAAQRPVVTYFHPYDIDIRQERFMHPDLNDKWYLNLLMYIGRARVLSRLETLHGRHAFLAYDDFIATLAAPTASTEP